MLLDFGCGGGSFLRGVAPVALSVIGVELQRSFREELMAEGFRCIEDVSQLENQIDSAFMFHVLEHLSDPITTLQAIRTQMS